MPRYFIELSYLGTNYSGFQVQQNANTVQSEMEKALTVLLKKKIVLTGSSRTDAGVHARQNYFHFDIENGMENPNQLVYKLNALLPVDIAVRKIIPVGADAHCRFDAVSREYYYYITRAKDPFRKGRSYYFPFKLDRDKLQEAAVFIKTQHDFTAFSKRNTQAKSFLCTITESEWLDEGSVIVYRVRGNRFLRGMVRALTATMLKIGRGKIGLEDFEKIFQSKDCSQASFAVPADGLFLTAVEYPPGILGSVISY
jgi:tRNA pseudouridine38-40 synthase